MMIRAELVANPNPYDEHNVVAYNASYFVVS